MRWEDVDIATAAAYAASHNKHLDKSKNVGPLPEPALVLLRAK